MQSRKRHAARKSAAVCAITAALQLAASGGCADSAGELQLPFTAVVAQPMEGSGVGIEPQDFAGVFALRVVLPVQWEKTPIVQGGSGNLVQYARVERVAVADDDIISFQDTISVCGIEVPEQIVESKIARLRFDESEFNGQGVGQITIRNFLEERGGQTRLVSDWANFSLGTHPAENLGLGDPWPGFAGLQAQKCSGIAARFDYDPANNVRGPRSSLIGPGDGAPLAKVQVATRNIERVISEISPAQNDRIVGTVEVHKQGNGKFSLESTIMKARDKNGSEVNPMMLALGERFVPAFSPAGSETGESATSVLIRIDPDMTCAQIRALDFN